MEEVNKKPKRLAPSHQTLRELYMKSGNQCAYPDCKRVMINDEGKFVGQVCHIEAAEEGGERFNVNQSPEDRRQFDNLMLMCYDHHIITNDVEKYSVEKLKDFKRIHEEKFSDIAQVLRNSVTDHTEATEIKMALNALRLNVFFDWRLSPEELDDSLQVIQSFAERLRALPIPTRELLSIIVKRASSVRGGWRGSSLGIAIAELKHTCNLAERVIWEHIHILEKHGFVFEGDPDEFLGNVAVMLTKEDSGWDLFEDIKRFCDDTGVPVESVLVDLDFRCFGS